MTTSVPAYLTWPLLVLMGAIVLTRYLFFNRNQYETYLNHTLALMVVSNLLRERAIEEALAGGGVLSVTAAQQLSLAVMVFAAAEFMGFVTLWSRLPLSQTRRRHRYHRISAAALAGAALVAGTPARHAGQTLEVFGGWSSTLAWAFFTTMYLALAVQLMRMTASEVIRPDAKPRERLVSAVGVALAIIVGTTSVDAVILSGLEEIGWVHSIDFRLSLHGYNIFWETVSVCVLATVPAVLALSARAGWDATSRHWRDLQPLRASMTAAVPASVFELRSPNNRRRKTSLDLHQTTVQIRDAILQLRSYAFQSSPAAAAEYVDRYAIPDRHREAALQALQIAQAVHAKAQGAAPMPVDASTILSSRSANLEQETAELLRVARWWPHAVSASTADPQRKLSPNP